MLRKLKEFIGTESRPPRQCEACGQPFVCGASLQGCWCFGVKLSAEARQQMRGQYKDCLCSTCLQRFAEGKTNITSENTESTEKN